jgi:hypothetical protein
MQTKEGEGILTKMEIKQQTLTGEVKEKKRLVKSISYSQEEIIKNIMKLYKIECFDLDPTYSTGNFYKKIPKPRLKFDIEPQISEVQKADCTKLPLNNSSVRSIMFDPPFIAGIPTPTAKKGIISSRFGSYMSIPRKNGLWEMYRKALIEFYRILEIGGVLVIKCQDTISDGNQFLSHVELINYAYLLGFYPKDLFVLLAENRVIKPYPEQKHSRKYHSYFLVFIKQKSPVKYTLELNSEGKFI